MIEIPATVGGKDIRGARVRLMVRLSNDGRIFFNGALAAQGDGRTLDPILITEKAAPGQKILVAVNTPYHADNGRLTGAQLMVDYPGQPDPGVIRTDIQSAEEVINGFPNGKDDHERQLDAAVKAIDFAALDRGDQPAFTRSLDAAASALQPLAIGAPISPCSWSATPTSTWRGCGPGPKPWKWCATPSPRCCN